MVFPLHVPYSLGITGIFCQTRDYVRFISQRANIFCELWLPNNATLKAPSEEKRKASSLRQMSSCSYLLQIISLEALHLLGLCQGTSQQAFWRQSSQQRTIAVRAKKKHWCIYCYYPILLLFHFWFVSKISPFAGNFLLTCWKVVALLGLKKLEEEAFKD